MHDRHLTQLLIFFVFYFFLSVESTRTAWVLFPPTFPVLFAAFPFPQSGCWEVKRERADGVAFSKKCGITGASWRGDGERNCARCDTVGGVKGWGEKPWKKGGEGTPQLPVLPLTPLSLCLSTGRPTVWEAGHISTGRCTTPSFVRDSVRSFPELQKLNCNYLPSNVFLLYLSLSWNLNFRENK